MAGYNQLQVVNGSGSLQNANAMSNAGGMGGTGGGSSLQGNGSSVINQAPVYDTTSYSNASNFTPAPTPAAPVLNTAAIAATQKSIDQLDPILQRALAAEAQNYQNAQHGFDEQEKAQRSQYDKGTFTNQQNYDANLMASLRAGANGLSGLLSILRGTGVEDWARNVVDDTTNSDIRDGLNTRQENQGKLDSGLNGFLADLQAKRDRNKQTYQDNQYAAHNDYETQLQKLYQNMAKYYADANQNDQATTYLTKAGDLAPQIAEYSVSPVGKYDTSPVPVRAAEISAFAAPTEQNVSVDSGDSPAGIFTIGDARKRLAGAGA